MVRPCHAVSPVLDKIAEERADELKLVKINVDEEQELMIRYGVQSIPTIVLFKDGAPAAAVIGAQPKGAIERRPRALVEAEAGLALRASARAAPPSRCGEGRKLVAREPSELADVVGGAWRAADDPSLQTRFRTVLVPGPSP